MGGMGIYVIIREFQGGPGSLLLRESQRSHWKQEAVAGSLVGYKSTAGVGDTIIVRLDSLEVLRRLLKTDPYSLQGLVRRTRITELEDVAADTTPDDPAEDHTGVSAAFLTAHESRIAQLVVDGMTNCQIADLLRVSQRAIEQHITRIYRKLSIGRRAQLADALHDDLTAPATLRPEPLLST
jgi:DNA-binding NarL/FixJ family response regulator